MKLQDVTRSQALQHARNYRGAKANFQMSVYWAVNQALHGNADGLYMVMLHAGMLSGKGHEMTTCADGRQLWAYWNADHDKGGLGLKGIITWDKDKVKFKMKAGWQEVASNLDLVALQTALSTTRWDQWNKIPASKAFDLEKAIKLLVTRASNNGITTDEVIQAIQKLGEDKKSVVKDTTGTSGEIFDDYMDRINHGEVERVQDIPDRDWRKLNTDQRNQLRAAVTEAA